MTLYKIALGTNKRTMEKKEGGRGEIGKGGRLVTILSVVTKYMTKST